MSYDEAHRAIKRGQIDALSEAVPKTMPATTANRFGWTLLMLAAMEGNTKIGKYLIDSGAEVNALNDFQETALSLAAHKGHIPFMELLVEHGALPIATPHGSDGG